MQFFFQDRVLLCNPACTRTWFWFLDQAGLKLTEIHLPLSPQVLELKICALGSFLKLRKHIFILFLIMCTSANIEVTDSLEPELQNWTQVLWKSR